MLFRSPVLMVVAYNSNGKTNVMNAAWGQISAMDKVALFIDEEHRTTKNIRETKAFTVSIVDLDHMAEADRLNKFSTLIQDHPRSEFLYIIHPKIKLIFTCTPWEFVISTVRI